MNTLAPQPWLGVHTAGLPGWLEFSVMIQLLPSYKHDYSGSTTLARGTHCWSAWLAKVQCRDRATSQLYYITMAPQPWLGVQTAGLPGWLEVSVVIELLHFYTILLWLHNPG